MKTGSKRLADVASRLSLLAIENPCGWGSSKLEAMADAIDILIKSRIGDNISLNQLADYYNTTARNILRWRNEYKDFPKPVDENAKPLSFLADECVRWKVEHPEKF